MRKSFYGFYWYMILASFLFLTGCAGDADKIAGTAGEINSAMSGEEEKEDREENVPLESLQAESTLPQTPAGEYMALVEGSLDGISFRQMEEEEVRPLSDMLLGHYDVAGRSAGDGVEYYVAVRREDAPEYEDYSNLSVGYFSGEGKDNVLQIGYYDSQTTEKILYELDGYTLAGFPLGTADLSNFCLRPNVEISSAASQEFACAFGEDGRETLAFMKKWPGLSFYQEGDTSIQFYYQDEDTLKFYSEPYPCYIKLEEDEVQKLKELLSDSKVEEEITSAEKAREYFNRLGKTGDGKNGVSGLIIPNTGAGFLLDGQSYSLFGNCEDSGYLWCSSDMGEFRFIARNQEVYDFVMKKISDVMGLDYDDFDPRWFESPLKSASIVFPEFVAKEDGTWETELRRQTVTEKGRLELLRNMMDETLKDEKRYGFSGCPYQAYIDFVREDGERLRMFVAVDSCDSMTYKGRIGLEYGSQQKLAEIFDEAMADRLE